MTTNQIYKALRRATTLEYLLENTYVFNWESDIFGMSKNGYCVELEIKSSRADFLADFKKEGKHKMLEMAYAKKTVYTKRNYLHYTYDHTFTNFKNQTFVNKEKGVTVALSPPPLPHQSNQVMTHSSIGYVQVFAPNRFWYACPEGMIKSDEVPKYAGLYWVNSKGKLEKIKTAPLIHKTKHQLTSLLLHKFYHKSLNLQNDLQELKRQIDFINENCLEGNSRFELNNNEMLF